MLNIGDKVKGFESDNRMKTGFLPAEKRDLIGEVGTVVNIVGKCVKVDFENKDDQWWFNTEEAEKHKVITLDMEVKVKKMHPEAVIPSYAKSGDAGLDLTAVSKSVDEFGNTVFDTGLAFEIPEGYVGLLFPRSSNAKTDLRLTNSVGVLDSGYRGSVLFKYRNDNYVKVNEEDRKLFSEGTLGFRGEYEVGDRVGQLIIMPYPKVKLIEVADLSETERGEGSYGSSGK